jgi:hypothetical protein
VDLIAIVVAITESMRNFNSTTVEWVECSHLRGVSAVAGLMVSLDDGGYW